MNYFEIRAKRNRIYLARIYATRNVLNISMREIIERMLGRYEKGIS